MSRCNAGVLNRWKEHFEEHLNSNVIRKVEASGNINYGPELEISELTTKMKCDMIKNFKNSPR
jgi:hypothetical protein